MRYFGTFTAIVLLLLGATNPTIEQYSGWLRGEIATASKGNPLVALAAYTLGDPIIQATTQRRDFVLFSIFATKFDENHQAVILGVGGNFFALPIQQATPWIPGTSSPIFPHVTAANDRDTWRPEDGYVWVRQPPNGDLRVRWQPGRPSEKFRHVVTASAEERWFPEDGYAWDVNPPPAGQLGVHWVAGKPSTQFAHVISGTVEGQWFPEDGFEWNITPPPKGQLAVHWVPGISSKLHFHVVSAIAEGHWLPDSGYRWVVDPPSPGDFRVEPLLPPTNPAVNAEIARRPDNVDEPSVRRALAQEREFLFGIDHGQGQYALDLACDEANPPCPRWWDYARRVSARLGVPLCSLDFQRDLGRGRYASTRYLPLTQPCVVPGGLTSTGPLRCDHDGCCKPGVSC